MFTSINTGVLFSVDGKWTRHIDYILSKASKQVCVLRKLKFILKREIREKTYLAFIRPLLEYSCEVWDNCSQTDNDRLEQLQLEAARIVTGLTAYSSRDSLYQKTGWKKLSNRRERKKLCLMYNMYHGHAPSYLCDLLTPLVRDITKYPVRNRNDYTIPRCRLSLYQFSFILSVINLWSNRGQFSFIYCTTIIIRERLELDYLEILKKTKSKIYCYRKQYIHSLRTVGDSLKEHNSSPLFVTYLLSFNLSIS